MRSNCTTDGDIHRLNADVRGLVCRMIVEIARTVCADVKSAEYACPGVRGRQRSAQRSSTCRGTSALLIERGVSALALSNQSIQSTAHSLES